MKRRFVKLLTLSLISSILTGCGALARDAGKKSQDAEEKLNKIKAEALTADQETDVTFDVNIVSYDTVNGFSYELMKHNLEEKNPVLSPMSAYLALSMAGNGARGETLDEFHAMLGNNLNTIPYEIIHSLQKSETDMTISFANSVWAAGVSLSPSRT